MNISKTMVFLAVLVLAASFVSAQAEPRGVHEPGTGMEQPELRAAGSGQGIEGNVSDSMPNRAANNSMNQTRPQLMNQARNMTGNQTGLGPRFGLENALSRVRNENAREALQRNLDRWTERNQQRLDRMENVKVNNLDEDTGAVEITAEEPVKWLGLFKGRAKKRFQIDKNGKINERAPWYRFMYSESE